jgi:hypothetical protein
MSEKLTSSF